MHNKSHIGDLAALEDWSWTLEPGVQQMPKIPVSWSIIGFGLDPMKGFSMIFDGWQRNGWWVSMFRQRRLSTRQGRWIWEKSRQLLRQLQPDYFYRQNIKQEFR